MVYTPRREVTELIAEANLNEVPSITTRNRLYDIFDRRFDFDKDGGIILPAASGLVGAVTIDPNLGAEHDVRRHGRGRGNGGGRGRGNRGGGNRGNGNGNGMLHQTTRGGIAPRRMTAGGRPRGRGPGRGR
ncbi:hypothetical protein HDU76_013258 [Blyttiomyces sp. JEL0837]|nr:hypothetical protein HDU76_013258 [Blyttiomyces sp. JEL0837]